METLKLPDQPTSFFCYIRRLLAKSIGNVPEDTGTHTDIACIDAGCTKQINNRCVKLTMLESNSMRNAGVDTREGFYKTDWSKFNNL